MHTKLQDVERRMGALEEKVNESSAVMENRIEEAVNSKLEVSSDQMKEDITEKVTKHIESTMASNAEALPSEEKVKEIASKSAEEALREPAALNTVINELEDREKRRNNLIIYGLTESKEENSEKKKLDDKDRCYEILKFVFKEIDAKDCTRYRRLGKEAERTNRPIVVEIRNEDIKEKILKGTKLLKDSQFETIGISHDLTRQQRNELKELLKNAREKSEGGKKHKVVGGPGFWQVKEVKKTK